MILNVFGSDDKVLIFTYFLSTIFHWFILLLETIILYFCFVYFIFSGWYPLDMRWIWNGSVIYHVCCMFFICCFSGFSGTYFFFTWINHQLSIFCMLVHDVKIYWCTWIPSLCFFILMNYLMCWVFFFFLQLCFWFFCILVLFILLFRNIFCCFGSLWWWVRLSIVLVGRLWGWRLSPWAVWLIIVFVFAMECIFICGFRFGILLCSWKLEGIITLFLENCLLVCLLILIKELCLFIGFLGLGRENNAELHELFLHFISIMSVNSQECVVMTLWRLNAQRNYERWLVTWSFLWMNVRTQEIAFLFD